MYGVTRQRISQVFKEYGLKARPKGRPNRIRSNLVTCKRCFEPYQYGTYKEHKLTPAHLEVVPRRVKYPERDRGVVADYKAGINGEVIAEKYGIQQERIYGILRRYGIKPDRGGGQYKRSPEQIAALRAGWRRWQEAQRLAKLNPNGKAHTGHHPAEDTGPRTAAAAGPDV